MLYMIWYFEGMAFFMLHLKYTYDFKPPTDYHPLLWELSLFLGGASMAIFWPIWTGLLIFTKFLKFCGY